MHREKLVLSASPPRNETLRQAYQGRVWRTPVAVLSREVAFWGLGLLLVGIALNHQTVTWMGAAMASTLAVIGLLQVYELSTCTRIKTELEQRQPYREVGDSTVSRTRSRATGKHLQTTLFIHRRNGRDPP